jgi:hypothetical protein
MGHIVSHAPQPVQRAMSPAILRIENREPALRKTVTGQTYLQNARLSRSPNASPMPSP